MLTSAGKKEHLLKNFSYWLLLANWEYCKIFQSIYYEEHLQMAAPENVFMKQKKNIHKITIPAFWEGNLSICYITCKKHLF